MDRGEIEPPISTSSSGFQHHHVVGSGCPKSLRLEHLQLVSNLSRLLEIEVFGVFHHLFLELLDGFGDVLLAHLLDFGPLDGCQL